VSVLGVLNVLIVRRPHHRSNAYYVRRAGMGISALALLAATALSARHHFNQETTSQTVNQRPCPEVVYNNIDSRMRAAFIDLTTVLSPNGRAVIVKSAVYTKPNGRRLGASVRLPVDLSPPEREHIASCNIQLEPGPKTGPG
jgi:hypothetical protein